MHLDLFFFQKEGPKGNELRLLEKRGRRGGRYRDNIECNLWERKLVPFS